eukprot:CAMPEP_0197591774 /NCGR_PEP_ID=MMETSP1326-20131121/13907_1 /TAXON_ID=1155430 /ORGANISM="Genus nov. species nov., Strain RCC2288" /LENGTH=368 /DNA_ID=CAMNT_0043157331 /DNA_START=48 /DNA_END=1154 /DNA_ORIENTATION=+
MAPKRAAAGAAKAAEPKKGKSSAAPGIVDDKKAFLAVFAQLRAELVSAEKDDKQVKIAVDWIDRMVEYNVPHGKLNRGIAVVEGIRALMPAGVPADLVFKASVVGWCIEWLQAAFLVWDDMMDESVTRRGQPCWYKAPGVGTNAINDGLVLECQIYSMLKKHCKVLPCYAELLELFHDVSYKTASGQLIDLITAPIGQVDLTKYTMEAYMRIVTYKTAFYTFYLPAATAMRLAGITDEKAYTKADEICQLLGQFFQIQDDYLDCYGDPAVIGKIGTDIMDNKCGWLVVQALKKCNAKQKKVIEANYGKKDPACEKKIKELYVELDLEGVYQKYEEESYKKLKGIIEGQKLLPHELFGAMLAKIYKRTK